MKVMLITADPNLELALPDALRSTEPGIEVILVDDMQSGQFLLDGVHADTDVVVADNRAPLSSESLGANFVFRGGTGRLARQVGDRFRVVGIEVLPTALNMLREAGCAETVLADDDPERIAETILGLMPLPLPR